MHSLDVFPFVCEYILYKKDFSATVDGDYDVYHSPQSFKKLIVPASERKGLLTQAGILAMNSGSFDDKEVNPTARGIWHTNNILCDLPDSIPSSVVIEGELASANLSLKEKLGIKLFS